MIPIKQLKRIFDKSFTPTPGCWLWGGSLTSEGYGRIKIGKKQYGATRVCYLIYVSSFLPDDLVVRHKCDNPRCVNPEHLLIGTHADNMKDKSERGRQAKGSKNAKSKLNEEQVREIRDLPKYGWNGPMIAEMYGISRQSVYAVLNGKNWSHLP